jgi:hypothetical protein
MRCCPVFSIAVTLFFNLVSLIPFRILDICRVCLILLPGALNRYNFLNSYFRVTHTLRYEPIAHFDFFSLFCFYYYEYKISVDFLILTVHQKSHLSAPPARVPVCPPGLKGVAWFNLFFIILF